MEIRKETQIETGGGADEAALEAINRLTRRTLTAQEVYTFRVRLCDNEIDRDFERFDDGALEKLAALFVGKSGIFDHQWSSRNQTARIFRAEVVTEPGRLTRAGEPYRWVRADAYMLRSEKNRELIDEIEGGIKREVSVGCAVSEARCSVCGETGACAHTRGQVYGGKLCHRVLSGVTDAFEWSFVAVPAQPAAGVVKAAARPDGTLAAILRGAGRAEEYARLEREAEAGRRYLATLRGEIVRLGLLADDGLGAAALERIAAGLGEAELDAMRRAYEKRLEGRFPPAAQLPHRRPGGVEREEDRAFLI